MKPPTYLYSHEHSQKPRQGDWVLAGGLVVELLEPFESTLKTPTYQRQHWAAVGVEGSLFLVELIRFGSACWETFFVDGDVVAAEGAQYALLFGELV